MISFFRVLLLSGVVFSFVNIAKAQELNNSQELAQAKIEALLDKIWGSRKGEWLDGRATEVHSRRDAVWHIPQINNEIQLIANRLLASAKLPEDFVEVSATTCNYTGAFISSGGIISVCIDLIHAIEKPDELAFVLAHEIAHMVLDHASERELTNFEGLAIKEESISATLERLMDSGEPSNTINEQERSSDLLGIDLMVAAGFSIDGALTLFDNKKLPHKQDDHYDSPIIREEIIFEYAEEKYIEYLDAVSESEFSDTYKASLTRSRAYYKETIEISGMIADAILASQNYPPLSSFELGSVWEKPPVRTREQSLAQACYSIFPALTSLQHRYPDAAEFNTRLLMGYLFWCSFFSHDQQTSALNTAMEFVHENVSLDSLSVPSLLALISLSSLSHPDLFHNIYAALEVEMRPPLIPRKSPSTEVGEAQWISFSERAQKSHDLANTICAMAGLITGDPGISSNFSWAVDGYTEDAIAPYLDFLQKLNSSRMYRSHKAESGFSASSPSDYLRVCNAIKLQYRDQRQEHLNKVLSRRLRGHGTNPPREFYEYELGFSILLTNLAVMRIFVADADIITSLSRALKK